MSYRKLSGRSNYIPLGMELAEVQANVRLIGRVKEFNNIRYTTEAYELVRSIDGVCRTSEKQIMDSYNESRAYDEWN